MEEEEFINDMQFSDNDLDAMSAYHKAMAHNIDFKEEEYIDDIPNVISGELLTLSE